LATWDYNGAENKRSHEYEITDIMNRTYDITLTRSLVHKDIEYSRQQARETIKSYLDQYLPEQFHECILGLDKVRKIGWNIIDISQSDTVDDKRMRLAGASLVNQCISLKSELLANVDVINESMTFVQQNLSSRNNNKELKTILNYTAEPPNNDDDNDNNDVIV
jgi:hypothetical protein